MFYSPLLGTVHHPLDLSPFDRLAIDVAECDGKAYTVGLCLQVDPAADYADSEVIIWAGDFRPQQPGRCIVRFTELVSVSRGHAVQGIAPPRELADVRRFCIACSSRAETQQGPFAIRIRSIFPLRPGQPDDGEPMLTPVLPEKNPALAGLVEGNPAPAPAEANEPEVARLDEIDMAVVNPDENYLVLASHNGSEPLPPSDGEDHMVAANADGAVEEVQEPVPEPIVLGVNNMGPLRKVVSKGMRKFRKLKLKLRVKLSRKGKGPAASAS